MTPQVTSNAAAYDWSKSGIPSGFEQVQRDDLGIPFLVILQKGSPEVDKTNPDYPAKKIEGAEAGDIINSLSREIYGRQGKPMVFVPCSFEKLYVEWTPREAGGGMVKMHKSAAILNECTRNARGQDELRNKNIIVTTAYFYGLTLRGQERVACVIGMSSTQLKKSRQWLNMMMSIKLNGANGPYTPPMFSHTYLLSSQAESNEKGSWMGWLIQTQGPISDPVLIADAIQTSQRAAAGQRAALPPPSSEEKDDVPFA